jgi:hypothetical protein
MYSGWSTVFFLTAVIRISVKMKRQPGYGLRKYPHARIDRRHLHGGHFIHVLAGRRTPEKEAVAASGRSVLRLIP